MKLYVIRHGESEANAGKFFSGWAPVALTPKGEDDARAAGELIRHIPFDKVYSSDIRRVIQTQQLALPDADCERTPLIREYNVGSLMGKNLQDCAETMGEAFLKNRAVFDFTPYGGESNDMVDARVAEFMRMLEQTDYENVAVFSHAGTIRSIIDYVLGVRTPRNATILLNGAVSVFEFIEDHWRILMLNYTKEL